MTADSEPHTLRYDRSSYSLSVPGDVKAQLGGDLPIKKRIAVDDFVHGYDVREEREPLLPDGLIPKAGLIDLLTYRAANRGFRLEESADTPIAALPTPASREKLSWPDLADFAFQNRWGLIRTDDGVNAAILIADFVTAFPEKRIMVLGRASALKPVYLQLLRLVPDDFRKERQLAFVHSDRPLRLGDDAELPRLICCTSIAAADLDSEKCDIVVMLDAFDCMHQSMEWPLIQMDARFRLFGIVRSERKCKPYDEAQLRRVFGFREISLKTCGRVRRETCFAWIRQGGQASAGAVSNAPAVGNLPTKEEVNPLAAYVHNHYRNDRIARLAKKLQFGVPLEGERYRDVRRGLRWLRGRCPRIVIFVDRLDHAIHLARRLPGWEVVAQKSNLQNISSQTKLRISAKYQQWVPCQIVVVDATPKLSAGAIDVAIWAAGGSAASVPESFLYGHTAGHPFLIIDFLDDFDAATHALSFERSKRLERRDIFRIGTSAVVGRILRLERMIAEGTR